METVKYGRARRTRPNAAARRGRGAKPLGLRGHIQMTSRLRGLLFAGAAISLAAPSLALAADAATEVDEVVVTGHIEEPLPQTLSQYGARLVTVTDQRVQ